MMQLAQIPCYYASQPLKQYIFVTRNSKVLLVATNVKLGQGDKGQLESDKRGEKPANLVSNQARKTLESCSPRLMCRVGGTQWEEQRSDERW